MWRDHSGFTLQSADGHSGCFPFGDISTAAPNTRRTSHRPVLSFLLNVPSGLSLQSVNTPGASGNGRGLSLSVHLRVAGPRALRPQLWPRLFCPGFRQVQIQSPLHLLPPPPTPLHLERRGHVYTCPPREDAPGPGVGTESHFLGPASWCARLRRGASSFGHGPWATSPWWPQEATARWVSPLQGPSPASPDRLMGAPLPCNFIINLQFGHLQDKGAVSTAGLPRTPPPSGEPGGARSVSGYACSPVASKASSV